MGQWCQACLFWDKQDVWSDQPKRIKEAGVRKLDSRSLLGKEPLKRHGPLCNPPATCGYWVFEIRCLARGVKDGIKEKASDRYSYSAFIFSDIALYIVFDVFIGLKNTQRNNSREEGLFQLMFSEVSVHHGCHHHGQEAKRHKYYTVGLLPSSIFIPSMPPAQQVIQFFCLQNRSIPFV